jgi:hypothetical protein
VQPRLQSDASGRPLNFTARRPACAVPMRLTVIHIKTVHTAIFAVLSGCVIYVLVSGAFNHITGWTWIAVAAIVVEGLVLAVSGGKCPLTVLAERRGAMDGSVSDIFLPKWFADRIFPICTALFLIGCALLCARLLG